ncbi:MAG: glycosyltransferase [Leucobacter sp.]
MQLSIIVPTRDESQNVAELVRRIEGAAAVPPLAALEIEVIFVDDSRDGTPAEVARVAESSALPISCVHREKGHADSGGGLGGAVLVGAARARADSCLVMDGDLQHPPERIGALYERLLRGDVDLVLASRYAGDGDAAGLAGALRRGVSQASILLTKALFPRRLHGCTDPMTGFFVFDRRRIDLAALRPQGFKILLEMLVRQPLVFAEVPFEFGDRYAGRSKASLPQGWHFLLQLLRLRFSRR